MTDKTQVLTTIQEYLPNKNNLLGNIDAFSRYLGELYKENRRSLRDIYQLDGNCLSILSFLLNSCKTFQSQGHEKEAFIPFFSSLTQLEPDITNNAELHTAIRFDLVETAFPQPLGTYSINPNTRDIDGQALLHHLFSDQHAERLGVFLNHCQHLDNFNIDITSKISYEHDSNEPVRAIEMTAFQYAIVQGFRRMVATFVQYFANLNFVLQTYKYTPLQLAIHHRHYDIAQDLLCSSADKLELNGHAHVQSPLDMLCTQIKSAKVKEPLLKTMALFLYFGAEAPALPKNRAILASYRDQIIQEMLQKAYDEANTAECPSFLEQVKDPSNTLHEVFYARRGFIDFAKRCFFKPSTPAFQIVDLIKANENLASVEDSDAQHFVEFVRLYNEALDKDEQQIPFLNIKFKWSNPNSGMRWLLEQGIISNWQDVLDYADQHPTSRTHRVVQMIVPNSAERATHSEI